MLPQNMKKKNYTSHPNEHGMVWNHLMPLYFKAGQRTLLSHVVDSSTNRQNQVSIRWDAWELPYFPFKAGQGTLLSHDVDSYTNRQNQEIIGLDAWELRYFPFKAGQGTLLSHDVDSCTNRQNQEIIGLDAWELGTGNCPVVSTSHR